VTIPALGSNTGPVQTVTLSTPTGPGQYAITASATGLPTASSSTVTVTQTAIFSVSGSTLAVGLQHPFSVSLDSPAPDSPPGSGGLVVSLSSSNTQQVTLPSQVIVPTGQSSVSFTAVGITSTVDANGVDHPVTITASTSTSQKTTTVSVVPAVLQIFDLTTTRSTFSQPQTIRAFVLNSFCSFCFGDVLTNPLTVTFAAVDPNTGGQSSIVTVSPTQVTIPALGSNTGPVQTVTLSTPTGTGQYVVTASASGLPTASSSTVNVTQPSVTSISGGTLAVGMQHNFFVTLDSPAPSQGVVINLASSDSSLVSVPPSVTIAGGQASASFVVTGVALPAGVSSQTVEISASAQGVTGLKSQASIVPAALSLFDLQTSQTTFSHPQTIRAFVLNSSCTFCFADVLTNPLTVTFTAIDPNTGGPSSIVTVSPTQVTIPALGTNTGSVQTVTLSTPSATGSYAVVLSAPGLPSVTSGTVTVTLPHVAPPNGGQTMQVAALMHRDFSIQLDSPAPQGGLTIGLSSSDTTKFSVPASVTVLANNTSVNFTLTGVTSTHDQQGLDHPATLTLTGPQPWIGSSASVSVATPTFTINNLQTSRTTQSAPDQVSISIFNPACNCGDVLNSAIAIGLSIQSTTSSIATVNPATVSAAANTSTSSTATISTPTTTGTYTLIVSANGFSTFVSTVVTVQ
jgi:trimeric autotransporter adhesin